jgi:hypothetical protein
MNVADRQLAIRNRASVRGGALVGAYYTEGSVTAKKNAVDQDYLALDQAQSAYYKTVVTAQKDRLAKGSCTGAISPTTGWNDCLTADEIKFVQWRTQFSAFTFDWNAYKAGGVYVGNSGKLDDFDDRLKALRASFESISKVALPVPTNPSDPGILGGGGGGGGGGGSTSIFDTLSRLIWIGGILVIGYFAFVYIVPAFLGAGTSTRLAKRRYEEE